MAMYTVLTSGICLDEIETREVWALVPTDQWATSPAGLQMLYQVEYQRWVDNGKPAGACPKIVRDDANYEAYQHRYWLRHETQVLHILDGIREHNVQSSNGWIKSNVVYASTML